MKILDIFGTESLVFLPKIPIFLENGTELGLVFKKRDCFRDNF